MARLPCPAHAAIRSSREATNPGRPRVSAALRGSLSVIVVAAMLAWLTWAPLGHAASRPDTMAAPGAPSGLVYEDVPNDAGHAMRLDWRLAPDDVRGGVTVVGYRLDRAESPAGPWVAVDSVRAGTARAVDRTARRDRPYFYRVTAVGPGGETPAGAAAGPAVARATWFHSARGNVFAWMLLFFSLVLYFMAQARAGKKPFVRRIPGIDAIEEAIGRATEMGRPVLFVPGIQDIEEIQTVAGLVILESVARITARYETPIRVPVAYPIPFTIAQEMVRSGAIAAGRPDAVDADAVTFVSPEQFAYVAAIGGIILRDRPAAHLYMGSFFGESLLLAETGHATGAIQVAATANVHQLPFFVVACDYTLIGEELFAASAYLSRDPRQVGGLKGADWLKLAVVVFVLVGCVLETFGIHALTRWMTTR